MELSPEDIFNMRAELVDLSRRMVENDRSRSVLEQRLHTLEAFTAALDDDLADESSVLATERRVAALESSLASVLNTLPTHLSVSADVALLAEEVRAIRRALDDVRAAALVDSGSLQRVLTRLVTLEREVRTIDLTGQRLNVAQDSTSTVELQETAAELAVRISALENQPVAPRQEELRPQPVPQSVQHDVCTTCCHGAKAPFPGATGGSTDPSLPSEIDRKLDLLLHKVADLAAESVMQHALVESTARAVASHRAESDMKLAALQATADAAKNRSAAATNHREIQIFESQAATDRRIGELQLNVDATVASSAAVVGVVAALRDTLERLDRRLSACETGLAATQRPILPEQPFKFERDVHADAVQSRVEELAGRSIPSREPQIAGSTSAEFEALRAEIGRINSELERMRTAFGRDLADVAELALRRPGK